MLTVRGATGQTIQLPAFQQRGLQTTVVVPDRGSISLGGFSGARQSRLRFAPPFFGPLAPSRALSGSRGVGNMQMRVWVHDLQAMDAAILTEASQAESNAKKGTADQTRLQVVNPNHSLDFPQETNAAQLQIDMRGIKFLSKILARITLLY